jgi:hypothetical protein
MHINIHAQTMINRFAETGSLGIGVTRSEYENADAIGMVERFSRDCKEITLLDNTEGDRNSTSGIIELTPEAAGTLGGGFPGYTSCIAEFKGSAQDPEEMLAAIGGESKRIMRFAVSGNEVTLFDAIADHTRGHVTAGRFTIGKDKVKGYLEELNIPWQIAK